MALQYSVRYRNNVCAQFEQTTGASPLLRLMTGTKPADCAAAQTGTQVYSNALPSDWMAAPSNGAVALNGLWQGNASTAGIIGYFRIYDAAGTTCDCQGSVSGPGGGGDMIVDNVNLALGQQFTVLSFGLTAGGA